MFKKINVVILLIILSSGAFGDSELLQFYIHEFSEAEDNAARVNILRTASLDSNLNDEPAAALYENAIQYALENFTYEYEYFDINNIIIVSLNALKKTGGIDNLNLLWELFLEYPVPEIKAEIIITLGNYGKRNSEIIENINNYLMDLNGLFSSGQTVDYITVSASITALMELDDLSSYHALLDVIRAGYPEVIASEASGALDLMGGDLNNFLIKIIEEGQPKEKFAALKAGINSNKLSVAQRGRLAELALEVSLDNVQVYSVYEDEGDYAYGEEKEDDLYALSYAAVSFLSSLRWTRANDIAVRYFYSTLAEFNENYNFKNRFIEAVDFLGAVGNSGAALALCLQLGLRNDIKERTGVFDAEITLAIVRALGLIGDNASYNDLLRASTLSYNENITSAAREAMSNLKW